MTYKIFFGTNSVFQFIGLSEKKVVETFLNLFINICTLFSVRNHIYQMSSLQDFPAMILIMT
jgi:hypothetical protein